MNYLFKDRLNFSKTDQDETAISHIMRKLHGCIDVTPADVATDKKGSDYIARLPQRVVHVDAKMRERGCSEWWKNGEPEVAIEIYSVKPDARNKEQSGWTIDPRKITDMILYMWHPADTEKAYLFCFHTLRAAAIENVDRWRRTYKVAQQNSDQWSSLAVFVPVSVVMCAMWEIQQYLPEVAP